MWRIFSYYVYTYIMPYLGKKPPQYLGWTLRFVGAGNDKSNIVIKLQDIV